MGEVGAFNVYCEMHCWTLREVVLDAVDVGVVDEGVGEMESTRTRENVLLIKR